MKPPSKQPPAWNKLRNKVLGLGERSMRKSYYPELQARLGDLERFRALLDRVQDGIVLVRVPTCQIVDLNETARRVLEIDRENLREYNLHDLLGFHVIASCLKSESSHEEKAQEGREQGSEPTVLHLQERSYELSVKREIIGEEQFAVVWMYDVTERLKAEAEKEKLKQQLHRNQRLESLGKLAGGVAHDFNNLLTSINGNAELSLMELDDHHPLVERMQEIIQAGQSAAGLTRQLLAFSRKQLVEPRVLNLNDVIDHTQKMLKRLIGEDIHLSTHLEDNLPAIRIDPGQVEQILVNLAVNARDAMPIGGKLTLETSSLELDSIHHAELPQSPQGKVVMLAVSDDGTGMDADTCNRVFEPFFTTKEQGRGTGLGLAMVYGAVKQHGGSIEVYSELGRGSTFKAYFPAVFEQSDGYPAQEVVAEVLPRGSETILLVEDNTLVRRLAVDLLRRQGYQVLEAKDGLEALQRVAEQKRSIDLLFTDVVMPGMNGKELALELAEHQPQMKVLYSSGYTEQVIAHHGVLEAGIHFLGKPYTTGSLSRKVRIVLDESN